MSKLRVSDREERIVSETVPGAPDSGRPDLAWRRDHLHRGYYRVGVEAAGQTVWQTFYRLTESARNIPVVRPSTDRNGD